MANPILPPEEPSEFDGMSAEQVAAFVFKEGGEQALRQTLQMAGEPEPHNREDLEQIASALEARGLAAPATILREIAADTPSGIEANPYKPGSTNWSEWRRSWLLHRRSKTGELEADLRRRMSENKQKHRTNGTNQH